MKILIVAAHHDDETLGCGGTIARLSAEGHEVHIAILGEGAMARNGHTATDKLAQHKQSAQVAKFLGAVQCHTWLDFGLPDNQFDTVPLLKVVQRIENIIDALRPAVVYTQHGGDLNNDHSITYRAVLTATRPTADCPVREVYAYEVGSSTEWAFSSFAPQFFPNVFVNIAATLDRKIAAMQCYESEARTFPHPRSPEALRAQALFRGAQAGLQAAEAFQLVRCVR